MRSGSRPRWLCVAQDFLERAGWTAAQQFFAVLLTTSTVTLGNLPWELALCTAAGAAVLSLLGTAVQYLGSWTNLPFWPDLAVRAAKTFLASLVGTLAATTLDILTWDWATAVDLAAVATLIAVGKGLLARGPAEGDNPSTMPPANYRAAVAGKQP